MPALSGPEQGFLQQRTAVHADPARLLLRGWESSAPWMRMPGWENGFVVALLFNKHFKACLLPLGVLVCRALPEMQPGVKADSRVQEALLSNGK